jgi:hypothetical protein
MQLSLLAVGLALAAVLAPQAEEGGGPVAADPIDLGGPLVVGDIEIPQDEIKRFLIYGPLRAELEFLRVQFWIEHGIAQRVRESEAAIAAWEAAGAEPESRPRLWRRENLQPDEHRVQAHLDRAISAIEYDFPTLDLDTEIRRKHRHVDWFERRLRQEVAFDEAYIADDPDLWPPITFEALREEADEILIDDYRANYERRSSRLRKAHEEWHARVAAGDPEAGTEPTLEPEDGLYRKILGKIVIGELERRANVRTVSDGLSADLVLTMDIDKDGHIELTLRTDEMWRRVKERVSPEEVAEARRFLSIVEVTRRQLKREGWLLSPVAANAQRRWRLESESIHHIFDPVDFPPWYPNPYYGYPSPEAFRVYSQLLESYRRSVGGVIATLEGGPVPPELQGQIEPTNSARGLAKVDVEVLLCSAFDFHGFRWKESGWRDAEKEAKRLLGVVERGEAEWTELMEAHSEFWDPPPPPYQPRGPDYRYQQGRFRERPWSALRHLLAESDYSQFLNGRLLTDEIFFQLPVGSITGPHRCHWGYCLIKVLDRIPPVRPLDLEKEHHRRLLRDDWIRTSFIEYAQEALRQAQ